MNIYRRLFLISTLSQLIQKTYSEHVLPVFAGLWYREAYLSELIDSCGVTYYDYWEPFATSPETIQASDGYSYDSSTAECYEKSTKMPVGFISTEDDWNKILLDPNNPVTSYYYVNCTNIKTGNEFTSSYIAVPLYDCPPNTRMSYDNITYEIGCTTTPTPCVGDIVGRDLNLPSPWKLFDFFGHVGLVATWGHANPNILEVLNGTDPGIFLNPLYGENSFSTQNKYWGSRYEPLNFTRLSLTLASQLIQAGIDQQQYLFNYTLGWVYYPGGTEEHPDNCQFRCDSFVYYCYETGAHIKIQPYFEYPASLPITMFNYDFNCSADPAEYCSTYKAEKKSPLTTHNNFEIDIPKLEQESSNIQRTMTASQKIFKSLRPALSTKSAQKNQLPRLIKKYQGHQNLNASELFVRCLCFELKNMSPDQVAQDSKPILSDLLWKHKYLSSDNFLLSLMENALSFYLENPHCDWLNAYSTLMSNNISDKALFTTYYLDQQHMIEQANLISGSRLSHSGQLPEKKKCQYGKFFQYAYHRNSSLTQKERSLLWLALSEMKYPVSESIQPSFKC